MSRNRLELALTNLKPSEWQRFERFATEFLSAEFPDLRSVSWASGDGGRDAELFSSGGGTTQLIQLSVEKAWKSKIKDTAKRISETFPGTRLLIYATNQLIGPEADEIKNDIMRLYGIVLDVRDRTYFLDRISRSRQTEIASETLACDIVDPYLTPIGVPGGSQPLSSHETRAAHVYLSLQFQDDTQQKNLTKLSFEALVRSVLIHTRSESRMKRAEVHERVKSLLPNDDPHRIAQLVDAALTRLTKRIIRHWRGNDEFCLSHEECKRVSDVLAAQQLEETSLISEIRSAIVQNGMDIDSSGGDATTSRVRRVLDRCLYSRAESFAIAVMDGGIAKFATDHLRSIVIDDLNIHRPAPRSVEGNPEWVENVVRYILENPGAATRVYLRKLSDAYTLMAFLQQTPDVQGAVEKIFSHGEIWLDTSAILPLLAEELVDDSGERMFQKMIDLAHHAGLAFYVTDGVVEELDRHINRSVLCVNILSTWHGSFPFLLEAFLRAGRRASEFAGWIENFRGSARPSDDLIEYLEHRFRIRKRSLEGAANEAPVELRVQVKEAWYRIHERRRERNGAVVEPIVVNRLSVHDTENYVGVLQQRRREKPSPFGYSAWWLTLDRSAMSIADTLKGMGFNNIDSPVLSIDFLAQYLTFGPARGRLSKSALRELPVALDAKVVQFLTKELLEEASRIRLEMQGLPEHIIRRRVRDKLDEERRRVGPLAAKGVDALFEEFELRR